MEPGTKSTLKSAIWGGVAGALAAIIIGFAWGGWLTAGSSLKTTDEALLASRAAICVAQFMKEPDHKKKLNELKNINSWQRSEVIEKAGWDKMPGQTDASYLVSRACADALELLMEN